MWQATRIFLRVWTWSLLTRLGWRVHFHTRPQDDTGTWWAIEGKAHFHWHRNQHLQDRNTIPRYGLS